MNNFYVKNRHYRMKCFRTRRICWAMLMCCFQSRKTVRFCVNRTILTSAIWRPVWTAPPHASVCGTAARTSRHHQSDAGSVTLRRDSCYDFIPAHVSFYWCFCSVCVRWLSLLWRTHNAGWMIIQCDRRTSSRRFHRYMEMISQTSDDSTRGRYF